MNRPITSPQTSLRDPYKAALRWLIEHKSCSDFPKCWEACSPTVRGAIITAWGSDPWRD